MKHFAHGVAFFFGDDAVGKEIFVEIPEPELAVILAEFFFDVSDTYHTFLRVGLPERAAFMRESVPLF